VMAAWTTVVAFAQNGLESAGKIPTLLPTNPSPGPPRTGGGIAVPDTADLIGQPADPTPPGAAPEAQI